MAVCVRLVLERTEHFKYRSVSMAPVEWYSRSLWLAKNYIRNLDKRSDIKRHLNQFFQISNPFIVFFFFCNIALYVSHFGPF